jgi:putative membrane protein
MDTDEMLGEIDPQALLMGKLAVITLGLLAILVTLLISLVRTILKYYDLRLIRTRDGFKIESGLLNRRQIAARDHKIQILGWADNPMKRLVGVFDVFLKQASSVQIQNRRSIVIPGCEKPNLDKIRTYYFDDHEWQNLMDFGIHKKYLLRRFLYHGLLFSAIIFLATWYFFDLQWAMIAIIWLPVSLVMAYIRFKKWRIHINDKILYVQNGLFGNYNKVIKLYKIQNLELGQSLYHRWNDLCNITVYTASGKITIPFLPLSEGKTLIDYLLYKIEVDKRNWM